MNSKTHAFVRAQRGGFTLIELLVVVTIIGLLVSLCLVASRKALDSAYKTKEINAGRNLATALIASAGDEGNYLSGIDGTGQPVYKLNGELLTPARAGQRYPYRLAQYLNKDFQGSILVNRNTSQINKIAPEGNAMHDYTISAYPAMGMNIYCVGGVMDGNGAVAYDAECITNTARTTGSVIAFASAGTGAGAAKVEGYSMITPPTLSSGTSPFTQRWSNAPWTKNSNPDSYGFVDARYDGKAVCAFMDGSVRMQSIAELSDMRLWSRNAASQDNKDYVMTR